MSIKLSFQLAQHKGSVGSPGDLQTPSFVQHKLALCLHLGIIVVLLWFEVDFVWFPGA